MDDFKTPIRNKLRKRETVKIPASPLLKKIGFGSGVAVYELKRSPLINKVRSPWAIKKLIKSKQKNEELNLRLQNEAETLRKINHVNIVGFRAYMKTEDGRPILAMEECSSCLGDMIEERAEAEKPPFEAKVIIKVGSDISNALDYLHNIALLLHCDIKSYNILVKGDFAICKLCDFGVCLPLKADGSLDKVKAGEEAEYTGTQCWMAPEVLSYPSEITTKADIYAFGLTLWEMLALGPPIPEEVSEILDQSDFLNDDFEIPSNRKRPDLPEIELDDSYNVICELFYKCTEEDFTKRLSAKDLVCIFKEII